MKKLPKEYAKEMASLQTRLLEAETTIKDIIDLLTNYLNKNFNDKQDK